MKENEKKSPQQANELIRWAGKTILGPGVKKRIKKNAAMPHRYPGTTGILWLPEWQDGVL